MIPIGLLFCTFLFGVPGLAGHKERGSGHRKGGGVSGIPRLHEELAAKMSFNSLSKLLYCSLS